MSLWSLITCVWVNILKVCSLVSISGGLKNVKPWNRWQLQKIILEK